MDQYYIIVEIHILYSSLKYWARFFHKLTIISYFIHASIEDDFVTWRERFWPAVCSKFGIEATGEDISMRQFTLTLHDETLPKEKIFHGEPARLNSYNTQKP